MNITKAIELLNDGARIRRAEWKEPCFLEQRGNTFLGYIQATSDYHWSVDMFLSTEWMIDNDDSITVSFAEAIDALKHFKTVKLPEWKDKYLVYDIQTKNVVLKHLVYFEYHPTFEDLCADDWEQI